MCGGLIHPIAGKCKHCKGDLAGLRGGRPAAAQALPSIIATNTAVPLNPHANGHANGHTNGHNGHNGHSNGHSAYAPIPVAAQHVAMPMQLARQYEEHSAPILPQRVSARMATATAPRAAWWKSWPLIVIVLAVVAIVTAVVLMVWTPGKSAGVDNGEPTRGNKLMPAPERMETNPMVPKDQPPAKSDDPWDDNRPGARIDIPDDPDDDLAGGGGSPQLPPGNMGRPGRSAITGGNAVMLEVPLHFCQRAATCANDTALEALCEQTKSSMRLFDVQPPTSCAARTRCLSHVDTLDCSFDFTASALTQLTTKVQDCVEAITSC